MIGRRGLIVGLAGVFAAAKAPAIITTPGLLMPVRAIELPPVPGAFHAYRGDGADDLVREMLERAKPRHQFGESRSIPAAKGPVTFRRYTHLQADRPLSSMVEGETPSPPSMHFADFRRDVERLKSAARSLPPGVVFVRGVGWVNVRAGG